MNAEPRNERIAIEGMIDWRNAAGEHWRVLRWGRQVDVGAPGAAPCWQSQGPAVFTLLDASAVIQVSGSALQIVATGMVLNVVDPADMRRTDTAPGADDEDPHAHARGAAEVLA